MCSGSTVPVEWKYACAAVPWYCRCRQPEQARERERARKGEDNGRLGEMWFRCLYRERERALTMGSLASGVHEVYHRLSRRSVQELCMRYLTYMIRC